MSKLRLALMYLLMSVTISITSIVGYMYFQDYSLSKEEVIFVKTDIFDSELKTPIEFLKDEQYILSKMKNNVYDTNFKLAVFYSECAYQLLTESKNQYYYNIFLIKGMAKWDELVKQDPAMTYFKSLYLDRITQYTVQNTSK